MNIIEVISKKGVISTSTEHAPRRFVTPKPGDVVVFKRGSKYPFNSSAFGRVDGRPNSNGKLSVCCGGASVFLDDDGTVSISGGPFEGVNVADLKPTYRLKSVRFWNWGNNSPGASQGVNYYIERPVFLYDPANEAADPSAELDAVIEYGERPGTAYSDMFLHVHKEIVGCGYYFTVTHKASSHTAFRTKAELFNWLDERGLTLETDLPPMGETGTIKILGSYRDMCHMSYDNFYKLEAIAETREMSNARLTLARITKTSEGERTIHTLNPNCKFRQEFETR